MELHWIVFFCIAALAVLILVGVPVVSFIDRVRHNRRIHRRDPVWLRQFEQDIQIGVELDYTFRQSSGPDLKFRGRAVWWSIDYGAEYDHVGELLFELIEEGQVRSYAHARKPEREAFDFAIEGPIAPGNIVTHLMEHSRSPRQFIEKLGLDYPSERLAMVQ